MDIAIYKTRSTIEVLPSITINKIYSGNVIAYCLMLGWLQWVIDMQWTTNMEE